jgi:hypothetical protein
VFKKKNLEDLMADSKFNTSLEDKPRANVKSFIREVIADAGTRCTGQIQHGLLYLVLTDLQWRTLEYNKTQTSAGVITILPKFANKLPQRPADEDRSAAWTDYKMLKEEHIAVENATKDLKDKLLRSIPQEDRDELEDSEYGTLDLTILQVIQHLTTKYGTKSPPARRIIVYIYIYIYYIHYNSSGRGGFILIPMQGIAERS